MKEYRCQKCKYHHRGPRPLVCPKCGATESLKQLPEGGENFDPLTNSMTSTSAPPNEDLDLNPTSMPAVDDGPTTTTSSTSQQPNADPLTSELPVQETKQRRRGGSASGPVSHDSPGSTPSQHDPLIAGLGGSDSQIDPVDHEEPTSDSKVGANAVQPDFSPPDSSSSSTMDEAVSDEPEVVKPSTSQTTSETKTESDENSRSASQALTHETGEEAPQPPTMPADELDSSETDAALPTPAPSTSPPPAGEFGQIIWSVRESSLSGTDLRPLRNCVAVDNQSRIFVGLQNELVAIQETSDDDVRVLWNVPTGGFIPGSPVVGSDGHVRVHSADGKLYCVNVSGERRWEIEVGEPLGWASPSVDADGNTWICAYHAGLIKVDPDGHTTERPYFRSPAKFDCSGLIINATFYVGAEDQFVYAIPLKARRAKNQWNQLENRGRTGWFINSAPALMGDGTLLVASRDDHMYAFDLDGNQIWKQSLPGQVLGSPVVDGRGQVFVGVGRTPPTGKSEGALVCLQGDSGQSLWSYPAAGPVESTPVIGDDDVVYFGDNAGVVHAVSANGQARSKWTAELGSPIRSAGALLSPGRVAFGLDNGDLICLGCSSRSLHGGWPKYLGSREQCGLRRPT